LFNLDNSKTGRQYSLTAEAQNCTFVTKTKKPNGFHIFWLSRKQNDPISAHNCKKGYEFEIKTDKNGLCTLPPSKHRDDLAYCYKNNGKDKIVISDKIYDEIKNLLATDCIKAGESKFDPTSISAVKHVGPPIELTVEEAKIICDSISPCYKKGTRNSLVYGLGGLFRKHGVSRESAINVIQILSKDDEERRDRIGVIEETYTKDPNVVSGRKYLLATLEHGTGDINSAKQILQLIFGIIFAKSNPRDTILSLTEQIMNEYTFKTMKDTEEIYFYDDSAGIYVSQGDWIVKEQCELLYPEITSHKVQEVINHLKRKTGVDRSKFDSNPNILNLENGLLNIHTKELTPHSQDYLSTVQLTVTYKERTVCPKILQFLREVLRPKDIRVALQMIGYCLYKSSEYEKAFMFFGGGSNGKGVLIKLIEALLGAVNCSHRSLQDMDKNRFALANLYGKHVNTFADLKSLKLSETGNFKMLVSGDSITGEHKFGQPFAFRNYAKLIFSANEIPESDDKSDAFYRRWRIFHFDKVFQKGAEETKRIKKLTTPEELSGLLNLALIGLKQLIDEGGFHDKDAEQTRLDYEENTNDVNAFLIRECIVDISNVDYSTLATDLYAAYVNFCVTRKTRPVDTPIFGKKLATRGISNTRHREHTAREAYYDGVMLRQQIRGSNQELQ
jgi:P4 family phage/plasmid primase-like protien